MVPALADGDWVLAVSYRLLGRRPRVGDVVLARDPREPRRTLLKRVAVGPGAFVGGRQVPPGHYYLLGDNPAQSTDSRTFGPVSAEAIEARAVLRYWPPRRWGLVRW